MNFTKPSFHNSDRYQVSYYRMYKSASSTILNALKHYDAINKPRFDKVFTVIRNPFTRAKSAYREVKHIGKTDLNFIDYLKDIKENGFYDKHHLPQSELLSFCNFDLELFILEDYNWYKYIGLKKPLHSVNVKQKGEDIFTSEELELIIDLYPDDIDLYLNISK